MRIKKFIGLEGLNGSGKTTVLKELCNWLLSHEDGRSLRLFSKRGSAIDVATFPPAIDDFIAFIRVWGKVVVVATGGDDWWVPEKAAEILEIVSIEVDVYLGAIRKAVNEKRKHPSVKDGYERVFATAQRVFLAKERIESSSFDDQSTKRADTKWVMQLTGLLRQVVDE